MKLIGLNITQFEKGKLFFKNYSQLNRKDLESILNFRNDPSVRMRMFNTKEITLKEHLKFVETLDKIQDRIYFAVFKNNKLIGSTYTTSIVDNHSCEWGFYLNPNYIGTGIGIEIEFHFLNFLFDDLGMLKVFGWINKGNFDSLPIQELFGFENIGERGCFTNLVLQENNWNEISKDWKSFRKKLLKN